MLKVETRWMEDLMAYLVVRFPISGPVRAILENNLRVAIAQCEPDQVKAIVAYCEDHIPGEAWGSPERVQRWLAGE